MNEKEKRQIPLVKAATNEAKKDPITARFVKPLAGHGFKPVPPDASMARAVKESLGEKISLPPQAPQEEDFSSTNKIDANWADSLKDEIDNAEFPTITPEIVNTGSAQETTIIKKTPSRPPITEETSIFVEEDPGLKEAVLTELKRREVGNIVSEDAPTRKIIDASDDPAEGTRRALDEIENKYK